MSEEEKCREAFEREYSMLTGEKRAHALSVWTTCWNLRQQVPDGWVLVPKVETREMLEKAETLWHYSQSWETAGDCYRAMLAAAPKPEDVK